MNAPTVAFRGHVPESALTGTSPSHEPTVTDKAKAALLALVPRVYDYQSAFDCAAVEAARTGAHHVYDTQEAEECAVEAVRSYDLLAALDSSGRTPLVVLNRRRTEVVDFDFPSSPYALEPRARAVEVACTERVTVWLLGLTIIGGKTLAHIKVTIEGDYSS